MSKIHLADENPAYCASCYGGYPDRPHVDFGAAYDGPVVNAQDVVGTTIEAQTIDDLVICDECVKAAAKVIGYGDLTEVERELAAVKVELEAARKDRSAALKYADGLEDAVSNRPSKLTRPGRPKRIADAAR